MLSVFIPPIYIPTDQLGRDSTQVHIVCWGCAGKSGVTTYPVLSVVRQMRRQESVLIGFPCLINWGRGIGQGEGVAKGGVAVASVPPLAILHTALNASNKHGNVVRLQIERMTHVYSFIGLYLLPIYHSYLRWRLVYLLSYHCPYTSCPLSLYGILS